MTALSPCMRASTARTSSRVKTTGSRWGFLGPQDILDTFQGPIEHDFVEEENRVAPDSASKPQRFARPPDR